MKEMTTNDLFIGIDFGTSKTMVAEYDEAKRAVKPHKLGRGSFEIPSTIYATDGGELLYGDDADDEGITDSPNHITRFKMKLGTSGTAHNGRYRDSAVGLATVFLSHIKQKLESEVLHRVVDRVVLTVPAIFSPARRLDLKTAATNAGFKQIELLEEPVAAAIAYCNHHSMTPAQLRFIVVDWGGGTFDVALVERSASGKFSVQTDFVTGLEDIGGEDLDDLLWEIVSSCLESSGHPALEKQPKHEWGKYRRDLRRAKERLSTQTSVTLNFSLGDRVPTKVQIERPSFEGVIFDKIRAGANFVKSLIQRSQSSGFNPEFILLAGGTSRIPLISNTVEELTGIQCRHWSEGREAIALGAALHAHDIWGFVHDPTPISSNGTDGSQDARINQYKKLLEGVFIDNEISEAERAFLNKEQLDLGLSHSDVRSIQIAVLGLPIEEIVLRQNVSVATSSHKPDSKLILQDATNALIEGRVDEAIQKLSLCLLSNPADGEVSQLLVEAYVTNKDLKSALFLAKTWTEKNPTDARSWSCYARLAFDTGDFSTCSMAFCRIFSSLDVSQRLFLAASLWREGKVEDVKKLLSQISTNSGCDSDRVSNSVVAFVLAFKEAQQLNLQSAIEGFSVSLSLCNSLHSQEVVKVDQWLQSHFCITKQTLGYAIQHELFGCLVQKYENLRDGGRTAISELFHITKYVVNLELIWNSSNRDDLACFLFNAKCENGSVNSAIAVVKELCRVNPDFDIRAIQAEKNVSAHLEHADIQQLFHPLLSISENHGMFFNDVTVINQSFYMVTNVVILVKVTRSGANKTPDFKVVFEKILPGASVSKENVFQNTGFFGGDINKVDLSVVSCDQLLVVELPSSTRFTRKNRFKCPSCNKIMALTDTEIAFNFFNCRYCQTVGGVR